MATVEELKQGKEFSYVMAASFVAAMHIVVTYPNPLLSTEGYVREQRSDGAA